MGFRCDLSVGKTAQWVRYCTLHGAVPQGKDGGAVGKRQVDAMPQGAPGYQEVNGAAGLYHSPMLRSSRNCSLAPDFPAWSLLKWTSCSRCWVWHAGAEMWKGWASSTHTRINRSFSIYKLLCSAQHLQKSAHSHLKVGTRLAGYFWS